MDNWLVKLVMIIKMDKEIFNKIIHREPSSNKYDFGHVLVIGGSTGMVGAPIMTAKAALRTGCGLVTIASSENVIDKIDAIVPEIMTLACSNNVSEALSSINHYIANHKVNVVVVGPGLIPNPHLLAELINNPLPLLIDGGGLSSLIQRTQMLSERPNTKNIILTPHTGEFKRFFPQLNFDTDQLDNLARNFALTNKVTLVLKGNPTTVFSQKEQIKDELGGPELATAGSGDVLSGIIAGLLAQSIDSVNACAGGVYLHSLAGKLAAKDLSVPSLIASDIIDYLPRGYKQLTKEQNE